MSEVVSLPFWGALGALAVCPLVDGEAGEAGAPATGDAAMAALGAGIDSADSAMGAPGGAAIIEGA